MNKLAVILFGPPGSGKGTQAGLLAEKLGFYYLETSKVLEEKFNESDRKDFVKIEGKKYYFLEEKKKNFDTGLLCSPPMVFYLVKNKIEQVFRMDKSLILAGSPRTFWEAERLIPWLKKLCGSKNIKVVNIQLKPKDSIYRNSHRRICELMRHPVVYSEETAKLKRCPLDGSRLLRRGKLDTPEVIKRRLKENKKLTSPVIALMKKQGLIVKNINGEGTVEAVYKRTIKALK